MESSLCVSSGPERGANANGGELEVFWLHNARVWHSRQLAAGFEGLSVASRIGSGNYAHALTAARQADGRISVFVIGDDWRVWVASQDSAGSGTWGGFISIGAPDNRVRTLLATPNIDGRLEVLVIGEDYGTWRAAQQAPDADAWTAFTPIGAHNNRVKDIAVARNDDGRIEVLVIGTDDAVYRSSQAQPGGEAWTPYVQVHPNKVRGLAVDTNRDGRLELFVRGTDDAVYRSAQVSPGSERWGSFTLIGRRENKIRGFVPSQGADGTLEIFVVGTDHQVWHSWQVAPGSAAWSEYSPLEVIDGNFATPKHICAARNADGRLQLFISDDGFYFFYAARVASAQQRSPNPNTAWSQWTRVWYPSPPPATPPPSTIVPLIVGLLYSEAVGVLQAARLIPGFVLNETRELRTNQLRVVAQNPRPGAEVASQSAVGFRVELAFVPPPPPAQHWPMEFYAPPVPTYDPTAPVRGVGGGGLGSGSQALRTRARVLVTTPSLGDVRAQFSESCDHGDFFENNCAHFLSNAFIRAGFTELELYGARCPGGRPIRAREMWDWFRSKATDGRTAPVPNTGMWAVFQLNEARYWGGHVVILDSNAWRYYGTGWYSDWEQYLYQW